PFMAFADMVHSDQHIARSEYERPPVRGCEFKRPRQRDHELRFRIRVPIIRGMRRRFLEMDGDDQYIPCVEALEHVGKLRSVAASAADLLGVDLGAARSMQLGVL